MKKNAIVMVLILVSVVVISLMSFAQGGPGSRGGGSPLTQMDSDGDSSVSKKEWMSFHNKLFSRIDKDGNGLISESEFRSGGPRGRR